MQTEEFICAWSPRLCREMFVQPTILHRESGACEFTKRFLNYAIPAANPGMQQPINSTHKQATQAI